MAALHQTRAGSQPGQVLALRSLHITLCHRRSGHSSTALSGVIRFQFKMDLKQPSFVKKELTLLVILTSTTL